MNPSIKKETFYFRRKPKKPCSTKYWVILILRINRKLKFIKTITISRRILILVTNTWSLFILISVKNMYIPLTKKDLLTIRNIFLIQIAYL